MTVSSDIIRSQCRSTLHNGWKKYQDETPWNQDFVEQILQSWDESPYLRRLAMILRIRYGSAERDPGTVDDCGEALGVSKQRASQLESKANEKFREDYDYMIRNGKLRVLRKTHYHEKEKAS